VEALHGEAEVVRAGVELWSRWRLRDSEVGDCSTSLGERTADSRRHFRHTSHHQHVWVGRVWRVNDVVAVVGK